MNEEALAERIDWDRYHEDRKWRRKMGSETADAINEELRVSLMLVLDHVDYQSGACGISEMVGAALPVGILQRARQAVENARSSPPEEQEAQ